jgi:hypothetical protein
MYTDVWWHLHPTIRFMTVVSNNVMIRSSRAPISLCVPIASTSGRIIFRSERLTGYKMCPRRNQSIHIMLLINCCTVGMSETRVCKKTLHQKASSRRERSVIFGFAFASRCARLLAHNSSCRKQQTTTGVTFGVFCKRLWPLYTGSHFLSSVVETTAGINGHALHKFRLSIIIH